MTGFIILGVLLLLLCFLVCAFVGVAIDNDDNCSGMCMLLFVALLSFLSVLCFLKAGRAEIKVQEIVTPAYLIQEINNNGEITKDTTYIYKFNSL